MIRILPITEPQLLLEANPKRTRLVIQMQSTNIDATNVGRVHIGFGFQPVPTVGHASQGEILMQSDAYDEPKGGEKLNERYKGQVWAVADTASQSLVVEEEIES